MAKTTFAEKPNRGRISRPSLQSPSKTCKQQASPQGPDIFNFVRDILLALLEDIFNLSPRYRNADFVRDTETLVKRMNAEGLPFATVTLPAFFDGLLGYLETGKSVYPSFRLKGKRPYPHFLSGLVAPIYSDSTSSCAVEHMKLVYQFCVAFKKLQGPYKECVLREQLADFVQTDIDLNQVDFSTECTRDIVRTAREYMSEITKGLDPFDPDQSELWKPRPGPGATNTPTKHAERFRPLRWYDNLSPFDPNEWFIAPFAGPHTQPRHFHKSGIVRQGRRLHQRNHQCVSNGAPTSRFKFVPKTYKKARGICIEENEVQWHQQALRRGLYKSIEEHPLTRGRVCFTTQLVNQELAIQGSLYKEWATIDMSSASDRVSRKLVRYLFGGNQSLLKAIEAVSTELVELPKVKGFRFVDEIPINKIAPMGSAICFPVMALTHFCLIKAIFYHSNLPSNYSRHIYVFGDDIIVPKAAMQAVCDYLPLFGMKINTEKSFSNSYFRESCGVHAYKGVVITPVRFKSAVTPSMDVGAIEGSLRTEQFLYEKGYQRTASLQRAKILAALRKWKVRDLPYVDAESGLVGFYRTGPEANILGFRKSHDRSWGRFHQSWRYRRVLVFRTIFTEKSSFKCEEDRYLRWLTQGGMWAPKRFNEGISSYSKIARTNLWESELGYRC